MHICLISQEDLVAPLLGSVGEQQLALAKALRALGHRVTVIAAMWGSSESLGRSAARRLNKLNVEFAGTQGECDLYDLRTAAGVELLLVDFAAFQAPSAKSAWTLGEVLPIAASAAVRQRLVACEVLHGLGGTLPAALAESLTALEVPWFWTLSESALLPAGNEQRCLVASRSSQKAWSLPSVRVVPQGIDVGSWSPTVDVHLPARYDAVDTAGKGQCKQALQLSLELPVRTDMPLIGVWSADVEAVLAWVQQLPWADLLRNEAQIVVCSATTAKQHEALAMLLQPWLDEQPTRLRLLPSAASEAVHRLIAASDLLVAPGDSSAAELAGIIAQRYGAMPIVTEGLWTHDRFVDCDPQLITGNGWLVEEGEGVAGANWLAALQRGLAAYTDRVAFGALRQRVMRLDQSSERQARMLLTAYGAASDSSTAS